MNLKEALEKLSYETVYDTNDNFAGYALTGIENLRTVGIEVDDMLEELTAYHTKDTFEPSELINTSKDILFISEESIKDMIQDIKISCIEHSDSIDDIGDIDETNYYPYAGCDDSDM